MVCVGALLAGVMMSQKSYIDFRPAEGGLVPVEPSEVGSVSDLDDLRDEMMPESVDVE